MPTPVTHLVIAQRILDACPELVSEGDDGALGAFLLGSTLADVRVVTGEPRAATHFLRLPPQRGDSGIRAMLGAHPRLADPNDADPCARLMVAGYLAHLLADEIWLVRVYWPYFKQAAARHDMERLLWHDLLRSVVDQQDRTAVPRSFRRVLESARCPNPFPFISGEALDAWRELLLRELESPDSSPTFAHFASRYRLPTEAFVALLRSPDYMARVQGLVPGVTVARYREEAARMGRALVAAYLDGRVREFPLPLLDPAHSQPCDEQSDKEVAS